MTGKIIRSKDGPIACGTRLGWVISGRLGSGSPNLHCFETYLWRTAVEEVDLTDILRNDLDKFWAVRTSAQTVTKLSVILGITLSMMEQDM
jgi:hypothetical protein